MMILRGTKCDPLMRQPILDGQEHSSDELVLNQHSKPICRFAVRSEEFGYVLIRGARAVPVSHRAKPILDAFDGTTTLQEIQTVFGQEALDFVGSLYRRGFVGLK
jgi:hypothetical protein